MINPDMLKLGSTRSGIRELFEFAQERARIVGADNVFDFSIGNPSVASPPAVTDAIRSLLTEDPVLIHGYTSAQGLLSTRKAIASHLHKVHGVQAAPEDIIMTCGAAAGVTMTIRALTTGRDDEFLVQAPYFAEYSVFVPAQGGRLVTIAPDFSTFDLNLPAIEQAITKNTKAVLLNSPNNPSGHVSTRGTLDKLAAILSRKADEFGHPIFIVSDEPYRELVYGDIDVPYLPNVYANSIVCYSYSKSLSLPGERIGYVYVPQSAAMANQLVPAILGSARAMGYVCAPSLFQRVIERTVDVLPDLATYTENRALLSDGLKAIGYEVVEPDGAFYLFVKAPNDDAAAFSALAKQDDVLVVPGDAFGCPGYLRISYCVKRATIERALPRFARLFEKSTAP